MTKLSWLDLRISSQAGAVGSCDQQLTAVGAENQTADLSPASTWLFVMGFCCCFCFCFASLLPLRKQKANVAGSDICCVWPGLISTCRSLGVLGLEDLHMGRERCLRDVSLSRVRVAGLRKHSLCYFL